MVTSGGTKAPVLAPMAMVMTMAGP